MNLLPSQQKNRIEEAIKNFDTNGKLVIYEPCNCGSHVRHNNGGNYHAIITLQQDDGKIFAKFDSTSELEPPVEWEEVTDYQGIIKQYADWF